MGVVKGDPTYIEEPEKFYMSIAQALAKGSSHPIAPGGCVIVRGRDIIGDGRSVLAACRVEIDCVTYAIASAAKAGTALGGCVLYTTRYPFSAAIFQLHLMSIRKVVVLAHDWEPYYKDEFRRAARLARELNIAIEPLFEDDENRYSTNNQAPRFDDKEEQFENKDLYTSSPVEDSSYDLSEHSPEKDDDSSSF